MNVYDSELVASLLKKTGFSKTDQIERADAIFLNTCAIREKAEETIHNKLSNLHQLKKQKPIKIYGINYKDDIENLEIWLEKLGNPYSKIGIDKTGITGINWGVNGIPESFLIDKNGIIKHKINGVINEKQIKILLTKIESLEK